MGQPISFRQASEYKYPIHSTAWQTAGKFWSPTA